MRNKRVDDDPIYEVKESSVFDKINGFERNDEYEVKKRKKESENEYNKTKVTYTVNEEIKFTDYKNFNNLSESQKINLSNSFLKIYLRMIKLVISVIIGVTVIWAFMDYYMEANDISEENLEKKNSQNTVQTSTQNTMEKQYNHDFSREVYAMIDSISFGDYGTIPTVVKYGSYDGYYEWGPKENDPRFNGYTTIYEVKYEALPNLDIFNYKRALERRSYSVVGEFEGEDIYLHEVDTNKFLFVIICEDYAIYGAGNGDYKTVFNLK